MYEQFVYKMQPSQLNNDIYNYMVWITLSLYVAEKGVVNHDYVSVIEKVV